MVFCVEMNLFFCFEIWSVYGLCVRMMVIVIMVGVVVGLDIWVCFVRRKFCIVIVVYVKMVLCVLICIMIMNVFVLWGLLEDYVMYFLYSYYFL